MWLWCLRSRIVRMLIGMSSLFRSDRRCTRRRVRSLFDAVLPGAHLGCPSVWCGYVFVVVEDVPECGLPEDVDEDAECECDGDTGDGAHQSFSSSCSPCSRDRSHVWRRISPVPPMAKQAVIPIATPVDSRSLIFVVVRFVVIPGVLNDFPPDG